jgi:Zn-dependent protease with chaperone function
VIDAGGAPPANLGEFSDGVTAAVNPVTLTIEGDALVGTRGGFLDDVTVLHWQLGRVQTESLGDGRMVVKSRDFEGASLTLTADVAALLGLPESGTRQRVSRGRAVMLYGAGCVAAAALLYASAAPVSRLVAGRVPQSAEAALGQEIGLLLSKQYCETPAAREALQGLAHRLGARPDVAVHLMDASMVNAFTLPGGGVVVTRGLVGEAQGPDEVAGVLAHEIEHVARRHVLVRLVRSSLLAVLWQVSIGDFSGLLVVDPKTAFDIATLRFSRDDEREADAGGLTRLDSAGITRDGFRQFFSRMQAKTDAIPAWLSSHPTSAERSQASADPQPAAYAALDATAWQALRDGCKSK